MIAQFLLNGIVQGALIGVIALGFSLVYYTTKIFHIVYAFLFVFSAYIFYACKILAGINFIIAFLISAIATVLVSLGIDILYKEFEKMKGTKNMMLIVSLAVYLIGISIISIIFGVESITHSNVSSPAYTFKGILLTNFQILQLTLSLFISAVVVYFLFWTNLGLKIRALRDNAMLLGLLGKNKTSIRSSVFAISGFIVCIPACLISADKGIDPFSGMQIILVAVVAMIIGGKATFSASIIGGLLIGIFQSISIMFLDPQWEPIITFGILIIILLYLPNGLFGEYKRAV
jgi:branched-chain amino acid transport system permease protein